MRDELTQRLVEYFKLDRPSALNDLFRKMNGNAELERSFCVALQELRLKDYYMLTLYVEGVSPKCPPDDPIANPGEQARYNQALLLLARIRYETQRIPR